MKNIILPWRIDKNLRLEIIDFVNHSKEDYWHTNNSNNTTNRKYTNILQFTSLKLYHDIVSYKEKILLQNGIEEYVDEHLYGDIISVHSSGGNVHLHLDEKLNQLLHIRFNTMIQRPLKGGMPIIDDEEYDIQEGCCWYNDASNWYHSSTIVSGSLKRIVLSLGVYIKEEYHNNIFYNILKNNTKEIYV